MIKKLVDKVASALSAPDSESDSADTREHAIHMATAVLMVDVARADHSFDDSEFDRIVDLIKTHLDLNAEDTAELVVAANERAEEAVSAYEFTKLLHDNLQKREKARIVALLWQVAYADGQLDKYETSFVLKISDLLHVNRATVMRLKHDASEAQ